MPKRERKTYSGEFKQGVVEDLRGNRLSYSEAERKYNVARGAVRSWERIYLEEGAEGLSVERRGRACSAGGTRKGRPPKLEKTVKEDLISENQRLRMENDYLKKLNALVQAEEQQKDKKRR